MSTGFSSKFDSVSELSAESGSQKEFSFSESIKDLMFYILPIISFLVFLSVILFAVVPNLNMTLADLDELDKLAQEDVRLRTRIKNIQGLEQKKSTYKEIITKIDSIVPVGKTEVVKFTTRISETINDNGLESSDIKTGEEEYIRLGDIFKEEEIPVDSKSVLGVRQIPIEFSVKGSFSDIRNFFEELYKGQDFFVVEKMELSIQQEAVLNEQNVWVGDIVLVKYQFVPPKDFSPELAYGNITEENELDSDVIEFLNKKFVEDALQE